MPNSIAATTTTKLAASAGGAVNHNNTNMTMSETTQALSTTVFVNDASEKVQTVRPVTLDASLAVSKTDSNTISEFMSKPVQIDALDWTSAAAGTVLASYDVADYLTGSSVPNIWKNKISGYNLMRGTAVLKVVLNSQPFQAGRLIISFLPNQAQFLEDGSVSYTKVHNFSLCTKTQLPNVELDISDGTASIEIPYISPALWHSRQRGFDWGTISITVLSALASGASTTVNMAVYMYFKDFQLAAPIFGPEGFTETVSNAVVDGWNSAKRERNRTKDSGVVTTFFDFASKPLGALSSVPLIGPAAGEINKVFKSFGDVAAYFGWSRPIDMKGIQIVQQSAGYRAFNFNSTSTSDVLAMDSTNQLLPMTNFAGSEVDEMSFNYLKTIPAYIASASWDTADVSNTNVYSLQLSPVNIFQPSTIVLRGSSVTARSYPPFAYLSRFFRYYRGGLSVTIKIVKTQFHSGRLAVTYTPSLINVPTTAEARSYVYREIIDIRESDTFNFVLPYMHPAPYLNTGFNDAEDAADYAFGTFRVDVINPLVAATTVSSAVDILVYVNAADDFQLAALQDPKSFGFCPEMNTDVPRISGPIGDAPPGTPSINPAALCTGEFFTSVKQLYMTLRQTTSGSTNSLYTATNQPSTFRGFSICPYYPALPSAVAAGAGTDKYLTNVPLALDYISEISSGYAYSRGGIRLAQIDTGTSLIPSYTFLSTTGSGVTSRVGNSPGLPTNPVNDLGSGAKHLILSAIRSPQSGVFDVIVPHYGQTPFRLNVVGSAQKNVVPTTYDSPDYMVNTSIVSSNVSSFFGAPMRSGADDYATGYFIGFPPVVMCVDLT